jgi:hypothetical protein
LLGASLACDRRSRSIPRRNLEARLAQAVDEKLYVFSLSWTTRSAVSEQKGQG